MMRFKMWSGRWRLVGVVLLISGATAVWANALKYAEIHQRMETMASLQQRLSAQIDLARQIRRVLAEKKQNYTDEIKSELTTRQIDHFKKAVQQPRIHFNLELIGRLTGYIEMLDRRINRFQLGNERLAFLRQEADDTIKMIETLNDMQVESLLTRIDGAVAQYHAESRKDLLEPIGPQPGEAPQTVWQDILAEIK